MTLARDGWREMLIGVVVCGGLAALLARVWWPAAIVPAALGLFSLAFFRVPRRTIPSGAGLLVSPADGRVADITRLEHHADLGGAAVRIGVFLSVFDVHVNRAPCAARVRSVQYKPGEFLDARHPQCGERNEANTIVLEPTEPVPGPIVVRQIAGLIARRIVCRLEPGQAMARGALFGLIKFGSRTELIVPAEAGLEPAVAVGDKVRGGSSVLFRYAPPGAGVSSDARHRQDRAAAPATA